MNNETTIRTLIEMQKLTRDLLDRIEAMRIFFQEIESVCAKYRDPQLDKVFIASTSTNGCGLHEVDA